MQTLDGHVLTDLSRRLGALREALPDPAQTATPIPIPLPIRLPAVTTLQQGTATIGYVITPFGAPAPSGLGVTLSSGTLWAAASLFGPTFAATAGFVGLPFASATLQATGSVTFGTGTITLGAGSTLSFGLTPAAAPATGPASDPIGPDFLAAKLTPFGQATVTLTPSTASIALAGSGAATLYGQTLTLTPEQSPTLANLEFPTPHLAVSCAASQTTFTVAQSTSPEVVMAGTARIAGAGTVFPILTATSPANLPAPGDAWGIVVVTGAGLSATIAPLTRPLALAGAAFALTPVRLVGLLGNGAAHASVSYLLWETPPPPAPAPSTQPSLSLPASQIILNLAPANLVSFSATPSQELTITSGTLSAVVDRPVDGLGQRIPLTGPALVTRVHTMASITVDVGSTLMPTALTSLALVAENALIPVGTPGGLLLSGTLADGRIATGGMSIGFPANALVPTFPDPYAASYSLEAAAELITGVAAVVTWTATTRPALTVDLMRSQPGATSPTGGLAAAFGSRAGFKLLDVSTNADQWGVEVTAVGGAQAAFSGLQLQAPASDTAVVTVPGISWEPVVEAEGVPAWLGAYSPDDGVPTTFVVAVAKPIPIVPVLALEQYRAAAGTVATEAAFTLPFGITANLAEPGGGTSGPAYAIPSVAFPAEGLTGARVLSIRGAAAAPETATLPGTALTGFNETPPAYGAQVLGTALPSVASFWDQDFGPSGLGHFPVGRIDLSGYGTSLFSDWHDPNPLDPGIIRALFNVLLGRTAHEIITAQTWILPWCIRLQRTITFDRSDGGEVLKHDTGWQAVGAGQFALLEGPPASLLEGPVQSLSNVRNIAFATTTVSVGGVEYTPCTFDADVAMAPSLRIAANGKNPAASAVGTAVQGYAQDTITSSNPKTLSPEPPTAADILALMQQQGRVSGALGCIARVGGTGPKQFTMTVSSFGAAVATGSTAMLQTALFGTPLLPKDGQWSVSRRASTATVPQPVDPSTPVPLTQGTTLGATPPTGPGTFTDTGFRLLDPEDAQAATPATYYGIMQGTGTSKTLYEHPLINSAGTGLGFNNAPALADVAALLGIASLFPDIGSVLKIPSTEGLPIEGDGFTQTYKWGPPSSPAPPDRSLLDIAIVHLLLSYAAQFPQGTPRAFQGTLTLDASTTPTSWSLTLQNLSFVANVDGLGMLVTVCGGFTASSTTTPRFVGVNAPGAGHQLQVYLGPSLNPVQSILTGLSGLASALGGDALLDVGFSGNTLSVRQGFTLPTLPLGFGEVTHLGLDLGFSATIPTTLDFSVAIGSQQDPFQWVVSPLAGTGAIVLGVQGGDLNVFIEAALGLGLSISVAVASGSASIVVGLSLNVGTSEIALAAALTGNAQVDVLGGVASASLTLAAAITITVLEAPPPPQSPQASLAAQVSVGIHISICWVISVSFDGSWGFSETVSI